LLPGLKPPRVELHTRHHYDGRLRILPANIRLRLKRMAVANTLAYYIMATIAAVINFISEKA
jgi:hypothetical protein